MTGAGARYYGGRYRVDGILGQGGMSQVFHGYDERLDRRVAIKVLRPPQAVPQSPDSPEAAEILDGLERDRRRSTTPASKRPVYTELVAFGTGSEGPAGGTERDPTRPFRTPLLPPRRTASTTEPTTPSEEQEYSDLVANAEPYSKPTRPPSRSACSTTASPVPLSNRSSTSACGISWQEPSLAADGERDDAVAELDAVRPLLVHEFGERSTRSGTSTECWGTCRPDRHR